MFIRLTVTSPLLQEDRDDFLTGCWLKLNILLWQLKRFPSRVHFESWFCIKSGAFKDVCIEIERELNDFGKGLEFDCFYFVIIHQIIYNGCLLFFLASILPKGSGCLVSWFSSRFMSELVDDNPDGDSEEGAEQSNPSTQDWLAQVFLVWNT